jgi:(S)-ureidoglycine aminohydrolase
VHNLGQTRSCKRHNFFLLTPDTFVRTVLPGMKACSSIVHISAAAGAKFVQYTAEFESDGELSGTNAQRFIYVLEGSLQLEAERRSLKNHTSSCLPLHRPNC